MRPSNFIGIAVCVLGLVTAYYFFQLYLRLPPCPLCILDRFVLAAMGIIFSVGLFVKKINYRLALLGCNTVILSLGLLFASRHVWLQNQPYDESRSCLAEGMQVDTLIEVIRGAFGSEVDCGLILWQVFGLTIPDLTLILFIGLGVLLGTQLWGIREDKIANSYDR